VVVEKYMYFLPQMMYQAVPTYGELHYRLL